MSDQSIKEWLEDISTPAMGRVVLHAELPVSAGEPVLDDDKGKEVGRLDELVESGRPFIVHCEGYFEVVTTELGPEGAPVLHVKPFGDSVAVNEILAR
jgi:hypothetical protein